MDNNLKNKGLIDKYRIEKTNGNQLNANAEYFVLRYDKYGGDPIHIRACQTALLVYCTEIENHIPKLAIELRADINENKL